MIDTIDNNNMDQEEIKTDAVLPQLVMVGLFIFGFLSYAVYNHYKNGTALFLINPMPMTQETILVSSKYNIPPGNV